MNGQYGGRKLANAGSIPAAVNMTTTKLKKELLRPRKGEPAPTEFLSTGSTLLNLACTGKPRGGFACGHFTYIVGDSTSGKTFLALTCLAEAARNPKFAKYRFIFDQPEHGALMDFAQFFGRGVTDRIEMRESETIEDFYDSTDDDIHDGRPFIKILDSMDALFSEAEDEKFREQKTARRRGKTVTGSYGDGKAKKNSAGIRRLLPGLKKSGSILIVISQTRDNIGFGATFNPKTHAGGRALKFYATVEIWSSVREKIKRPVRGKQRTVGIICRCETKKNRITGRDRTVEFPIYHTVGIDDTGACVRFLIDEKHWKEKDGVVKAPEFRQNGAMLGGSVENIVATIESMGAERELQQIVAKVWGDIEAKCAVERKRRYE